MFGSTSRVNIVDLYHLEPESWIAVSFVKIGEVDAHICHNIGHIGHVIGIVRELTH